MICPVCKEDYVVCEGLKPAYGTMYQGVSATDYIEKCKCSKCGYEFDKPMDKKAAQEYQ